MKAPSRSVAAASIAETFAPMMKTRSWTLTAKLKADAQRKKGVIMAVGGVAAGMALYLKDGVPVFEYHCSEQHTAIKGVKPLPAGETIVELDFNRSGGGPGKTTRILLKVDGEKVGEGRVEAAVAVGLGAGAVGIGEDRRQRVTFAYQPPLDVAGVVQEARIDLK